MDLGPILLCGDGKSYHVVPGRLEQDLLVEWQLVDLGVDTINLVAESFSSSFIINVKCVLVLILDILHLQYTFPDVGDEPPDPIIGRGAEIIGVINSVQAMLC